MKKQLICLITFLFLINLSGCGNADISATSRDNRVLSQAIDLLAKANSYEFTRIESTFTDKQIISQMISEQKTIFEPYANWSKTDSTNSRIDGSQNKTLTEVYQIVNDDQFDMYIRYSSEQDPVIGKEQVLGDWENIATRKKEQVDMTIDSASSYFDALLYLLSSNIDTFKIVEDDKIKDENIVKYEGHLEQTAILEAYQKYIRNFYVKGNLLPDSKNMSLDDLKKEITSGDYLDIQVGIPRLAFSNKPIPVSLWIDKNNFQLKRAAVDETSVMQAYLESVLKDNPEIELLNISEAIVTYEIKGIDNLNEIPMPD